MKKDIEEVFNNYYNVTGQACYIRSNPIRSLVILLKDKIKKRNLKEIK